jgi:hypothetical protein
LIQAARNGAAQLQSAPQHSLNGSQAEEFETMSETTRYTSENGAVDWRGLADEIFPVDALRTSPTVSFLAVLGNSV